MKYYTFLAAIALPVVAAAAANAVALSSSVMTEKTVTVNGRQQIITAEAKHVVPGDRLILTTNYRNTTAQPVVHFVVTNPVPNGVAFAGESTAGVEVSVTFGSERVVSESHIS